MQQIIFPDVFSREYKNNAKKYAGQLQGLKNDPLLIGYFLRNEPNWAFINNLKIAEELLASEKEFVSKEVMVDFLHNKYDGSIEKLNEAWKTSFKRFSDLKKGVDEGTQLSDRAAVDIKIFSEKMIEEYVKIPSEAAKKVDPDHLNLGMRYAFIADESLFAGAKYFDVFSINCYDMDPTEDIEEVSQEVNMPVMIGEFHFGALDRGLLSTGLRGVTDQKERGKAYKYYLEKAAAVKSCVGIHYFILNDQAGLGRKDGENYQIGCVDVCHQPYYDFISLMREANKTVYDVATGTKKPAEERAEEIPGV